MILLYVFKLAPLLLAVRISGTFAQELALDTNDGFTDFDQPDVGDVGDGAYDMSMDFTGVRTPSASVSAAPTIQPSQSTTSLPPLRTTGSPPRNIQNGTLDANFAGNYTRNSTSSTSVFPNMTTTIPPRILYAKSFPLRPKAAVILTVGTSTAYDYNILAPALEVAFARAAVDYNVHMRVKNYLYEVDESGATITPDASLGKTQGCWMWNASGMSAMAVNDSVDVVIGPACTDDMRVVNELLTYFAVPCVTGAANLVDSTFQYKYLTRTGFSTYDMWTFLAKMMENYKWTSVCVIYDIDVIELNVEATSLLKNSKEHSIDAYDIRINGTEFEAFDSISGWLKECGVRSRVVVFVLKGMLRQKKLGRTLLILFTILLADVVVQAP
ncbi:hypothetical protein RvY_07547 [Ramazzottius varieornatus]|uniref:Receptor ligand binding region domain-containing protein n=1 Tax=Ramazzottius varieornatus TaxID=947166 RepID=A0A1D1V5N7_RAMVA|nr:hypothetical protein RvY_07547 [Ramazzottius varieornatus]